MSCAASLHLSLLAACSRGTPPAAAPPVALPAIPGTLLRARSRLSARTVLRTGAAASRSSLTVAAAVPGTAPSPPASSAPAAGEFQSWTSPFANRHRRTDIKRIMILGAGPIVIGQAGFFGLRRGGAVLLTCVCPVSGVRVRLLRNTSLQSPAVRHAGQAGRRRLPPNRLLPATARVRPLRRVPQ